MLEYREVHLQSVLQAISSRRSSNAIEEWCWCLQYTQPLTLHSPPVSPMVTTTTTKSWRSDTLIILPGWECHAGGSRSKPTVHRCSQSGRRLWVARQVTTTSPMAQPQCSKKQCINVNVVAEQSRSKFRSTARWTEQSDQSEQCRWDDTKLKLKRSLRS